MQTKSDDLRILSRINFKILMNNGINVKNIRLVNSDQDSSGREKRKQIN